MVDFFLKAHLFISSTYIWEEIQNYIRFHIFIYQCTCLPHMTEVLCLLVHWLWIKFFVIIFQKLNAFVIINFFTRKTKCYPCIFMARCTRYSIMWYCLSVTCDRLVGFSRYSGFLHQKNWPPRYNWNIVESGVKHH